MFKDLLLSRGTPRIKTGPAAGVSVGRSRALAVAALAAGVLAMTPRLGRAVTVELRNTADDTPASGVTFGQIDAKDPRHLARQYLKIDSSPSPFRKIYLYMDNVVLGEKSPLGGLILLNNLKDSIPLLWKEYAAKPAGAVDLSDGDAMWRTLVDRKSPAFTSQKQADALTVQASPTAFVFLGLRLSSGSAGGNYQARLIVEEVSLSPDAQSPVIAHASVSWLIFLNRPMTFQADLDDNSQVVSSTFYYRFAGETGFRSQAAALIQNPENPFRWTAEATVAPENLRLGDLEYYFTATDGFNESVSATYLAHIVAEDARICEAIPGAGGRLAVSLGDPDLGVTALTFPAGSLSGDQTICLQKVDASAFPSWNGQAPAAIYQFSPAGLAFKRPIRVSMFYFDDGSDGRVDGTETSEKTLRVFWFDRFGWRFMGGTVDAGRNEVTASISHFSVYGLFGMHGPLTEAMVRPQESIITPNGDRVNDLAQFNIDGDFEIDIMDVRGDKIRSLRNINVWDGRKDGGELVESGVYIYRLKSGALTVTGTLGVAR